MGGRRPTFPRSRAVSSALRGLTSLFGMGRGAPPRYCRHFVSLVAIALSAVPCALPAHFQDAGRERDDIGRRALVCLPPETITDLSREAAPHARPREFGPLVPLGSTSRNAHTCGLSTSSSATALQGGLISGPASRLDAFSAYPIRTRLPGCAPGGTTGTPLVRPTRSSRTKVSAPQASNARNR